MKPAQQIGFPTVVCAFLMLAAALPAALWADTETHVPTKATEALYLEANRLDAGRVVVQDFSRARHLYRQAAEEGHAGAQNQLGKYLHAGRGGAKDLTEALHWLQRAAEQGAAAHIYDLAVALEADGQLAKAATQYARAADAGHIDAAVSLGLLYQEGRGVARDPAKARAFYESGAARGHPRAQNNLGLLYARGDGVDQDYETAAQLFAAAADQGLTSAMTNLGVLYDNGFGVPQSDETAAMWYRRSNGAETSTLAPIYDSRLLPPPATDATRKITAQAAAAGDPVAQFLMGWFYLEDANHSAAAPWLMAAAEKGHGPSMANLAQMHFAGAGVLQDYVVGQMWALLALASGVEGADFLAESAGVALSVSQIAEAQQLAQGRRAKHTLPKKDLD